MKYATQLTPLSEVSPTNCYGKYALGETFLSNNTKGNKKCMFPQLEMRMGGQVRNENFEKKSEKQEIKQEGPEGPGTLT